MNRRTKIILIVVISIIILAGITAYIVMNFTGDKAPKEETGVVPNVQVDPTKEEMPVFAPPTAEEKVASSVKSVAIMFAEKFGSYSNQGNYLNVNELMPLMSDTMLKWAQDQYLPKLRKDHDPAGFYYQIVTVAPVAVVTDQSDATAKVTVSAQRTETIGMNAPTTFRQDLDVTMVKKDNSWLIDGAFWKAKK